MGGFAASAVFVGVVADPASRGGVVAGVGAIGVGFAGDIPGMDESGFGPLVMGVSGAAGGPPADGIGAVKFTTRGCPEGTG